VPPVPEDEVVALLEKGTGTDESTRRYLARISSGSPGIAMRLHEADVISRREVILGLFMKILSRENMGGVINDIAAQFARARFDNTEIDFDIIETIIHDLYLLGENRLDKHMINVDINDKFRETTPPRREILDIWNECCAETRRACTVNNVATDAGLMFFFISCAEAMENLARPKYTLP
jgi:hypothetical protein